MSSETSNTTPKKHEFYYCQKCRRSIRDDDWWTQSRLGIVHEYWIKDGFTGGVGLCVSEPALPGKDEGIKGQ